MAINAQLVPRVTIWTPTIFAERFLQETVTVFQDLWTTQTLLSAMAVPQHTTWHHQTLVWPFQPLQQTVGRPQLTQSILSLALNAMWDSIILHRQTFVLQPQSQIARMHKLSSLSLSAVFVPVGIIWPPLLLVSQFLLPTLSVHKAQWADQPSLVLLATTDTI